MNDKATEILPGISPIWAPELKQKDIPPLEWLVDQLISDAGINAISAKPGLFKTFLAIEIAKCVANGEPVFGVFPTKQTKVLIIDEESGERRLKQRQALLEADNADIAYSSLANKKISAEYAKGIIRFCKEKGIGLVIFDSLIRFHDAKESSNEEMAKVLADFQLIAKAGISVVIIHHDAKNGYEQPTSTNTLRGASDILANCDVHLSIGKAKNSANKLVIKQLKNRDAEEVPDFELIVHSNESRLWFEYVGVAPKEPSKPELTDNAIRELLSDGVPRIQKQIIEDLKDVKGIGREKMIPDRLKVLLDAGELILTVSGEKNKHFYELKPEQSDG